MEEVGRSEYLNDARVFRRLKGAKLNSLFFLFFVTFLALPCYYDLIGVTGFRVIKMKNELCCFHSLTSQ
jgi:hypothetical protein